MSSTLQQKVNQNDDSRRLIIEAIKHLDHVLPAQAPIQDFVHHNTLHGFQHLPFSDALAEAEKKTGIRAYLPETKYREYFQQGRVNEADLNAALGYFPTLQSEIEVGFFENRKLVRKDIYRLALLFDFEPISLTQLNWQIEELHALDKIQGDVPEAIKKQLLNLKSDKVNLHNDPVRKLWEAICGKLELKQETLHPEQLLDLNLKQTEFWLAKYQDTDSMHEQTRIFSQESLKAFFAKVGVSFTLRDVVKALSGIDILDRIRPQMIRFCASLLDEGVAAWPLPERSQLGLYGAWRSLAKLDIFPFLHELADYPHIIDELPEHAADCINQQLQHFEIDPGRWQGYLERLALEIPGWAGMVNWRQQHPNYSADNVSPDLADFLAIRLIMDRLWLNQLCREMWKIEAKVGTLNGYFDKNLSEFVVRLELFAGKLPEYLTHEAETLAVRAGSERQCRVDWQHLADLISIWHKSSLSDFVDNLTVNNAGWRLFRLFQHLGIQADEIEKLTKYDLLTFLSILDEFNLTERSKVWLYAYERHYREEFFQAIGANRERGRWSRRENRPGNQVIFCMDDREESFRRHLEELDPSIETLGAAGFFGVAMNYRGMDDTKLTALCPIVVTPAHNVEEQPRSGTEAITKRHWRGRLVNQWLASILHHGLRNNPILSIVVVFISAPFALFGLLAKAFLPKTQQKLISGLAARIAVHVKTELSFISRDNNTAATPERPRTGFTDKEQIDRVAGFLRNTGLTSGFAPLVVLMGHGSVSQNNPHLAAYDCGACSGRHGGPNARLFAAMANRPEVRKGLSERNIFIPEDTWFIGAEHNTCNENIDWYDFNDLPQEKTPQLLSLQRQLGRAQQLSAHERCRRLASAPRNPRLEEAFAHIQERAADYSQIRPELGHATNASAVVGRRSVTQGAFFDRRVFLISYDSTQDPEDSILEGILLAVGPVGAGINLEYYFSTVNNDRFGCGTKVPHNIVGLFAVMEGTSSDLRTGLPRQMIEIHEAMRLQLMVEAKTSVLEQIYARQESLQELIAGNWLYLSVIDPDNGQISVFENGIGFVPWQAESVELPVYASSPECYRDQTLPVSPALIKQPELRAS